MPGKLSSPKDNIIKVRAANDDGRLVVSYKTSRDYFVNHMICYVWTTCSIYIMLPTFWLTQVNKPIMLEKKQLVLVLILLCCVPFHVQNCLGLEDEISRSQFPKGFLFGACTSSYQVHVLLQTLTFPRNIPSLLELHSCLLFLLCFWNT